MIRRRDRQVQRLAEQLRLALTGLDVATIAPSIRAQVGRGQRLTDCELWTDAGEKGQHRIRACELPAATGLTTELAAQAVATAGLFPDFVVGSAQWTAAPHSEDPDEVPDAEVIELALMPPAAVWPAAPSSASARPRGVRGPEVSPV